VPTELCFDGRGDLRIFRTQQAENTYFYDFEGRLVEIQEKDRSTGAANSVRFSYLGNYPILIWQGSKLEWTMTWDTNGQLLRLRRKTPIVTGRFPNSSFAISDKNNSVVKFVDEHHNVLASARYDAWGNRPATLDPHSLLSYIGYKALLRDAETDFLKSGARWYWPIVGRWISEDKLVNELIRSKNSLGEMLLFGSLKDNSSYKVSNSRSNERKAPFDLSEQMVNLYTYAGNCPTTFSDPSGFIVAWIAIVAAVVVVAELGNIVLPIVADYLHMEREKHAAQEHVHPKEAILPSPPQVPAPPWESTRRVPDPRLPPETMERSREPNLTPASQQGGRPLRLMR
jgi:RHS repeat-associated protein